MFKHPCDENPTKLVQISTDQKKLNIMRLIFGQVGTDVVPLIWLIYGFYVVFDKNSTYKNLFYLLASKFKY